METISTLNLDFTVAQWLNETTQDQLTAPILTAHFMDKGTPVQSCYEVRREDCLRAAEYALGDFSPLEPTAVE